MGPNGCGKTAPIRTLLGEIPALSGRSRTALEAAISDERDASLVRTVMGRMGLRGETVNKPVERLSSGERARTLLARLILGDHNLPVLDDPTGCLDVVETQDVLLDALREFPGGIIFVSHDRHLTDALATRTLVLG